MCVYFLPCILPKPLTVSHLHQVNSLYRLFAPRPAEPVPLARSDVHKQKDKTGACRNTLIHMRDLTESWCCTFWFMQLNFPFLLNICVSFQS